VTALILNLPYARLNDSPKSQIDHQRQTEHVTKANRHKMRVSLKEKFQPES